MIVGFHTFEKLVGKEYTIDKYNKLGCNEYPPILGRFGGWEQLAQPAL